MAPPAAQRSGTNRRAQFGVFAGYLLASAGAALGALLLIVSLLRPEAFAGLRTMASDVTSSVGEAGAAGRVGTSNFFDAIAGYYEAGSKNAQMQEEIAVARVKLAEARALEQEKRATQGSAGSGPGRSRTGCHRAPDWVDLGQRATLCLSFGRA